MKIEFIKTKENKIVEKILEDLDSLYDDLDYYSDENHKAELEATKMKIKVREELLARTVL